jgi:hypothetical protein
MADFHMHVMLVEDIVKTLDLNIDMANAKLGSQGPDLFFFNIKSKDHGQSVNLANQMHNKKINQQLIYLTDYVKKNYSDTLFSFYVGYLTHYALDTIIHPYIFYYSGKYNPNDSTTLKHKGLHVRFERRVDIQFIQHVKKVNIYTYPVCELSYQADQVSSEISKLMGALAQDVYHVQNADVFYQEGYVQIKKVCRHMVYDRFGIKKILSSILDLYPKKSPIYYKDLSYHNNDRRFDYLNLNHQSWLHPVTKKMYKYDVIALYEQAKHRCIELISKTSSYIKDQQKINLENLFKNLSFDTGIDVDLNQEMKHFKLFNQKK